MHACHCLWVFCPNDTPRRSESPRRMVQSRVWCPSIQRMAFGAMGCRMATGSSSRLEHFPDHFLPSFPPPSSLFVGPWLPLSCSLLQLLTTLGACWCWVQKIRGCPGLMFELNPDQTPKTDRDGAPMCVFVFWICVWGCLSLLCCGVPVFSLCVFFRLDPLMGDKCPNMA